MPNLTLIGWSFETFDSANVPNGWTGAGVTTAITQSTSGVTNGTKSCRLNGSTGVATIRQTCSLPAWPVASNLVDNPDFETNASGWSVVSGVTISRSTAQAHTGVASLEVIWSGVGTFIFTYTTILGATAATPYVAGLWIYDGTGGATLRLRADEYQGVSFLRNSAVNFTTVAGWQFVSMAFTTGASTDKLFVGVDTGAAGDAVTVYVDQVLVQKMPVTQAECVFSFTNMVGDASSPLYQILAVGGAHNGHYLQSDGSFAAGSFSFTYAGSVTPSTATVSQAFTAPSDATAITVVLGNVAAHDVYLDSVILDAVLPMPGISYLKAL